MPRNVYATCVSPCLKPHPRTTPLAYLLSLNPRNANTRTHARTCAHTDIRLDGRRPLWQDERSVAKGEADVQPGDDCSEQIRKEKACQVWTVQQAWGFVADRWTHTAVVAGTVLVWQRPGQGVHPSYERAGGLWHGCL